MLENIIGDIQGYIEKVRRQNSIGNQDSQGTCRMARSYFQICKTRVFNIFLQKVTNNNTEQTLLVDREDPGQYFQLIWSDSSQSKREFSEKDIFC